ncbi:MAG: hypothetical protein AAF821_04375 [Cyanobacteria bacterium P01_D01_bin.156]
MHSTRYEIIEPLGKGVNGQTNLARLLNPGESQVCVVKQVYTPQEPLESLTKRLTAVTQHPQFPTLLNSWQTPDGQFFSFEYITAASINQTEILPWPPHQVEAWLLSLLTLLEHLHSFRLVHGDIRPINIRQVGQPILVDFRITQRLKRQNPTLATTGGDAAYAAPEQALGTLVYASDLYSLGLVAIHLLTGFSPFDLYSVADNRWIWPDLVAQPLPKKLSQVLHKMLKRSLEDRYAKAEHVIKDLKQTSPQTLLNKARGFLPKNLTINKALSRAIAPAPALPNSLERISWQPLYQLQTGITTALALKNGTLALGANDGKVLLCNLADATNVYPLPGRGHRDRITALAFHPHKSILYSASNDGTVKLWDLVQGTVIQTLKQSGWQPTDLAVALPYLIVSDGAGLIAVWDLDRLEICHRFNQHQDWVNRIAAKRKRLVSIGRDLTLRVWSLSEKRLLQTVPITASKGLALHPNGDYVVIGDDRGEVTVWPVGQVVGQPLEAMQLCSGLDSITSIALSPDARLLAVGTDGNALRVYDGACGQCVSELAQGWGVVAIAFDGHTLISSSQDETVTIWQRNND